MIAHKHFGLEVRNLTHRYGSKRALDRVSFSIARGEFCALLGPNGAGKSTLFALLTRLFVPESGSIWFDGVRLAENPGRALARIGVVFQQPTLDLDLTVRQNLSYFAALQGISGKHASLRMEQVLERLSMADRIGEKVHGLNGGHRRRMEIARALLHEPKILLLDEPTVGLDAASRTAITDHVHTLAEEEGMVILWATHLVDEVLDDDRLVILHRGEILADGTCSGICGDQTMAQTFTAMTAEDTA